MLDRVRAKELEKQHAAAVKKGVSWLSSIEAALPGFEAMVDHDNISLMPPAPSICYVRLHGGTCH